MGAPFSGRRALTAGPRLIEEQAAGRGGQNVSALGALVSAHVPGHRVGDDRAPGAADVGHRRAGRARRDARSGRPAARPGGGGGRAAEGGGTPGGPVGGRPCPPTCVPAAVARRADELDDQAHGYRHPGLGRRGRRAEVSRSGVGHRRGSCRSWAERTITARGRRSVVCMSEDRTEARVVTQTNIGGAEPDVLVGSAPTDRPRATPPRLSANSVRRSATVECERQRVPLTRRRALTVSSTSPGVAAARWSFAARPRSRSRLRCGA